ncbi:MAG: hypothetical protein HY822_00910 [Acidobacteria bacterium]|nr:hypothetical protein [Acidobacteriota bacterium]
MAAAKAMAEFAELLRSAPGVPVAGSRVGRKRPETGGDVPCVVLGLGEMEQSPAGIGRWIAARPQREDLWVETRGTRWSGLLAVEAWAAAGEAAAALADAVSRAVEESPELAARKGFLLLEEREAMSVDSVKLSDQTFASRAGLVYRMIHEQSTSQETGPGGIVELIHVDLDSEFGEHFDIRKP